MQQYKQLPKVAPYISGIYVCTNAILNKSLSGTDWNSAGLELKNIGTHQLL